jgi:glycerol-1-phosphate dehydrogenase [NAD(P)+]
MTHPLDLAAVRSRLAAAPERDGLRPLGLKTVSLGAGVLAELPDTLVGLVAGPGAGDEAAVLSDVTPKRYRGGDLLAAVHELLSCAFGVRPVLVGGREGAAHADEATVAAAAAASAGAACVVAVGSGTVADIGKAVAAAHRRPYAIVQTATSVNGFADDRSVLLVSGVKRTTETTWADALVVDTDVLVDAPPRLNVSGFADLIATFTAPADWYLATVLGMDDFYSPTVVALARDRGADLLDAAPRVRGADPAALEEVAATLTLSGLSMGVAGTTAPCSGMEHTVGHLIDMAAAREGGQGDLHGIQVGVASVCAALVWRHVLAALADGGLRRLQVAVPGEARARVQAAFAGLDESGAMAAECWRDYERKLGRWSAAQRRMAELAGDWARHDGALRGLLAEPEELVRALRSAGAPLRFCELEPAVDRATARWALASCHLMRERFSVADLAWSLGIWDDDHADAVLSEAEALIGSAA